MSEVIPIGRIWRGLLNKLNTKLILKKESSLNNTNTTSPFEKGGLGGIIKPYNPNLKPNARILRSNMTDAERLLWSKLRHKQILNLQFYRQKPLANFIVDFYCAAGNLVIELDGSQHFTAEHQAKDEQRDQVLQAMGLTVLRFNNHQVLTEIDAVLAVIFKYFESL